MAGALIGDVGVALLVAGAVSGDVPECFLEVATLFHHCTQLGSAVNEVSMKLRGSINEI